GPPSETTGPGDDHGPAELAAPPPGPRAAAARGGRLGPPGPLRGAAAPARRGDRAVRSASGPARGRGGGPVPQAVPGGAADLFLSDRLRSGRGPPRGLGRRAAPLLASRRAGPHGAERPRRHGGPRPRLDGRPSGGAGGRDLVPAAGRRRPPQLALARL